MRITITDDEINVENFHPTLTEAGRKLGLHTCRTVSHEAVAWAVKRLGEELERSCAFYRTGEPTDRIVID